MNIRHLGGVFSSEARIQAFNAPTEGSEKKASSFLSGHAALAQTWAASVSQALRGVPPTGPEQRRFSRA